MRGLDISVHNHDRYSSEGRRLPWTKIKESGADFVIIRTGGGLSIVDEEFQKDVNDAHSVGLKVGAYHYSYALNPETARQEAEFCKYLINKAGVLLELPVFFDMEDADNYKANNAFRFNKINITEICRAWFQTISPLKSGLYASLSWLEDYIDWKSLVEEFNIPIWNAQYNRTDDFKGYMWQFTSELYIDDHIWDANVLYDSQHLAGVDAWTLFKQS